MAAVDLKDACYTVPLAEEHQKYLKFMWNNTLFQYTCLPNGLASAPRMFTKLLKPMFATLREQGHIILGYIDDCLLLGNTKDECVMNVNETLTVANPGLYASFLKGQGHQGIFSLAKGTL